jgi:hypothetical protein
MHLNEAGFIWFVVYYSINVLQCSLFFLRLLNSSIVNLFVSVSSFASFVVRTMEEILNILNDKYRKVERGMVDILLSNVLAM